MRELLSNEVIQVVKFDGKKNLVDPLIKDSVLLTLEIEQFLTGLNMNRFNFNNNLK